MPARTKASHIQLGKRLPAPPGLSPAAAAVFKDLVASVDPGHFNPSDLVLVVQYAGAAALASEAQRKIDAEGAVVSGRPSPWVVVLEKASKSCVALSSKLRLNPQARFDRLVAGANARPQIGMSDEELDEFDPGHLLAR